MKKLKLDLRNIEGVEILTREQLKMVLGGKQVYQCECHDQTGSWYYQGGSSPSQGTIDSDLELSCENGGDCGWVTCGNPGAPEVTQCD